MLPNSVRLYLDNAETGLIRVVYLCEVCGCEIDVGEPRFYLVPVKYGTMAMTWKAIFFCDEHQHDRHKYTYNKDTGNWEVKQTDGAENTENSQLSLSEGCGAGAE